MLYFKCTDRNCSKTWTKLDGNGCRICDAPCEVISRESLATSTHTRAVEEYVGKSTELVSKQIVELPGTRFRAGNTINRHREFEELLEQCTLTAPARSEPLYDAYTHDGRQRVFFEALNPNEEDRSDIECESGKQALHGKAGVQYDGEDHGEGERQCQGRNVCPETSDTKLITGTSHSSDSSIHDCQSPTDSNSEVDESVASLSSDHLSAAAADLASDPATEPATKSSAKPTNSSQQVKNKDRSKNKPKRPGQHNAAFRRIIQEERTARQLANNTLSNPASNKSKKNEKKKKSKAELPLPDFLSSPATATATSTCQRQSALKPDMGWHQIVRRNAHRPLQDLETNTRHAQSQPPRPYASYLATTAGGAFGETDRDRDAYGDETWWVTFGMRGRKYDVRSVIARAV